MDPMEKFNLLNLKLILAAGQPESHWSLISKKDGRQSGLLIFTIVERRSGWHWKRDGRFVGAVEIEKQDIALHVLTIVGNRRDGFLLPSVPVLRMYVTGPSD
jgi:hypothetical protein